ncbi:MAG: hypothetical protein EPO40_10605 [Myxococcaceae bacterium]|nr:MAG: hypothetical protein EPO40_10605 [Myxococcaceae bacterium]
MAAHDAEPPADGVRRREWAGGLTGALVTIAGFCLVGRLVHRPVVVPLDAALTLTALVLGVLTWRDSPRRAVVRVLGFAATSSVAFAGTWIWLARGATLIGEGYADIILATVLYLGAAVGLVFAMAAGTFVADKVTPAAGGRGALRVRRAARTSLALLVFLALLGTHAARRGPPYERWLTSLPLRADLGVPATWPADAWTTLTAADGAVTHHRDLRVDQQYLRVYQYRRGDRFSGTHVCWQGQSVRDAATERSTGPHDCTRPNHSEGARLRVRRDEGRGLWIVDQGGRHDSGAFTDLGVRVGPSYASILSSAAPPASWVLAAWIAALLAVALLRWPWPRLVPAAALSTPYRSSLGSPVPADPAELRVALALTICVLHSAPLAAYFLRATLG